MDCPGENPLAGPGFSTDQHRRVPPGIASNLLYLRPDGLALANNLREGALPGQSIGDALKFSSALAAYTGCACVRRMPLEVPGFAHAYAPAKRAGLLHPLKNISTM